jgi:dipeptidyl-peptidase-4
MAPARAVIAGPEASKITYDHLGQYPEPGQRMPRQIQFSPDGKLITYLQSEQPSKELALFAFDVAGRSARRLLGATDLLKEAKPMSREEELRRERQRQFARGVTSYRWAKRAPVILLPFGGDVFVRTAAGEIKRLTETPAPELDPQVCDGGERVVFVRGGELFSVDVATGREAQLTRGAPEGVTHGLSDFNGQEEFEEPSGFWISPDCDRIAYLEVDDREVTTVPVVGYRAGKADVMMQKFPLAGTKNPRVRAGILDLATKKTTWLRWPREEERYLGRFAWSPDGKALFLQALSRDQKRLALVRADPRSGAATEAAVETSPTWIEFAPVKLLERSPRLLWTKPVGGHLHVELRDAVSGAAIATLTSGDWDVLGISGVDEEKGTAFVTGTKEGPTERSTYAVPLAGGAPGGRVEGGAPSPAQALPAKRITAEPGVHVAIMDRAGRGYVDVHSAIDRMWKVIVRGADGAALGELPVPVEPEVAAFGLRAPKLVDVRAPNGETLHGSLLAPRTIEPGRRYPVVVMVYGGPGVQTVFNAWSPKLLWNHLADRKVVVFQLDNRGTSGRGPAFEGVVYGRLGEIELADQIAGLDYLKTLPFADAGRVGIYGHSYGGRMTLLALLKAPDRFQVGVAASPATDDRRYDTGWTERYMGLPDKNGAAYDATDISKLAPNLRGKLLLMHGLMDENVHFVHTAKMIDAFVTAGKRFDLLLLPGERHGYMNPAASKYAMQRTVEYLTENL